MTDRDLIAREVAPKQRDKTLEAVQMLLSNRGYVVLGIKPGHPTRYKIGQILDKCCGYRLGQPFQVISETTFEDWLAQIELVDRFVGKTCKQCRDTGEAFYRVVTD